MSMEKLKAAATKMLLQAYGPRILIFPLEQLY